MGAALFRIVYLSEPPWECRKLDAAAPKFYASACARISQNVRSNRTYARHRPGIAVLEVNDARLHRRGLSRDSPLNFCVAAFIARAKASAPSRRRSIWTASEAVDRELMRSGA